MKNYRRILTLAAVTLLSMSAMAEDKEIVIVGTMHTVPNIVRHSYAPLFRQALAYKPDAILTEDIMPEDSISMKVYTPDFLSKSKESAVGSPLDESRFHAIISKPLDQMSSEDFAFLEESFLKKRDRANCQYYHYLHEYGIKGSNKASGNESDDLTHKLAARLGLRQLLPIDNHHYDAEYNRLWVEAVRSGHDNGDLELYNNLMKKNDRSQAIHALIGRLGKYTNKLSTLNYYYLTNTVRYAVHPNELTEQAGKLWDQRNLMMAQNIKHQIETSTGSRFILVVGAGHAISLKNALNDICPEVKVLLLSDLN